MSEMTGEATGGTAGDILDIDRFVISHIPLFALRPILAQLIKTLLKRHPNLFDRLEGYGDKRFLIDPTDLPFTLLLCPVAGRPELIPHARSEAPEHDAAISGEIDKFVELVNGDVDGDALFFSRDLLIEGDTEAVLALRNAIDDMEIDLAQEIEDILGPLAAPAAFARNRAAEAETLLRGLKTVLSETFAHQTINRAQPAKTPAAAPDSHMSGGHMSGEKDNTI